MSAPKLKDISSKTGFSLSTVSMVLNNRQDISIPETTRDKVKQAASKLGYKPKTRTRLSKTIIVATFQDLRSCFENPYFSEIYRGIEETMEARGFHAIIKRLHNKDCLQDSDIFTRGKADGVLVLGPPPSQFLSELKKLKMPVVIVNGTVDSSWDSVIPNYEAAFGLTLDILKKLNHSKILCVKSSYSDEQSPFVSSHLNRAILYSGLSEKNIIMVKSEGDSSEEGYAAVKKYLSENPGEKFTAAFSGFSKPFGVMRALTEAGYSVPEDISLIAIGIDPCLPESEAKISTILYPLHQVGQEGVLRLIQKAEGHSTSPGMLVLPVQYEDRGTVSEAKS
ncbi:LacI family DNA-binding transcriptional regulator [Puniceicoccus vermicola]|uniref:LacI family DNA-binding transcriptional regulator n=1 Tax=Puniceicoccus vermicola TaxID=388746 RepID=A0A7X1E3P5_9BACT|nr:LacI family DNA-binding transcriptional regulator [Puniceicoccus vermicola]MBC2601745.1 LacI family DNA-binding transcriptional regulator [Puniceicoccus vermicola]